MGREGDDKFMGLKGRVGRTRDNVAAVRNKASSKNSPLQIMHTPILSINHLDGRFPKTPNLTLRKCSARDLIESCAGKQCSSD